MKKQTLVELCREHGLTYVKQISYNVYKVYDDILEHYALVSWDHDKYIGYTIVSYTPLS